MSEATDSRRYYMTNICKHPLLDDDLEHGYSCFIVLDMQRDNAMQIYDTISNSNIPEGDYYNSVNHVVYRITDITFDLFIGDFFDMRSCDDEDKENLAPAESFADIVGTLSPDYKLPIDNILNGLGLIRADTSRASTLDVVSDCLSEDGYCIYCLELAFSESADDCDIDDAEDAQNFYWD